MFTDFELSFEFLEGQVRFSLFRNGITEASRHVSWDVVDPLLKEAILAINELNRGDVAEDDVLEVWTELIGQVIGDKACKKIIQTLPARLTIALEESVPSSHYDLFRLAPWDVAIARIGGLVTRLEAGHALADRQITVIDVRIAEEEQHEEISVAGIEQVPDSLDYFSEKEDENATGTMFPVWFGTNRILFAKDGEVFEAYEQIESDRVHYGKCDVWIPKSHRRGELKSPWYDPRRWHVADALRFEHIELTDRIVDSIRASVMQSTETNHLLFIHGFNNSFSDAVIRAAQVGFDLGISGATMAFSWPCRELLPYVSRYFGDGEIISGCRKALQTMAQEISGLEGTLHVVAHSMGNRALTTTWKEVFKTVDESETLKIGQVIFAAPDVYQQAFCDDTEGIHEFCQRATLYANHRDFALGLSRFLTQTPRAGMLPPMMPLTKIDTIEVPFNLALFGHTYFAKLIPMLEDLAALIEDDTAPGEGRRELLQQVDAANRHWKLLSELAE